MARGQMEQMNGNVPATARGNAAGSLGDAAIACRDLERSFRQSRRPPGFWGTIKWLVRPTRETVRAVGPVDLKIEHGECVAILGLNGAGKTTLLKLICGILWPSQGTVQTLGEIPFRRHGSFLRQIAMISASKPQLDWDLPPRDVANLNALIYGVDPPEAKMRIASLAEMLNVTDYLDVPVRELSFGQRMKCELVAGLVHRPRLLLLDEPTVGLDLVAQKNILSYITEYYRGSGCTVIYTSHQIEEAEQLCKRIILLHEGRVIFDGSRNEIDSRYADNSYLSFEVDPEHRLAASSIGTTCPAPDSGESEEESASHQLTLRVPRPKAEDAVRQLLELHTVRNLTVRQFSLREIVYGILRAN